MIDFGYEIQQSNTLNLDGADLSPSKKILGIEPGFALCIGCGTCTGGCSAGYFTVSSPRTVQLLINRGQTKKAAALAEACMLCGKCQMLCPRGISLRNIMLAAIKLKDSAETGGDKK